MSNGVDHEYDDVLPEYSISRLHTVHDNRGLLPNSSALPFLLWTLQHEIKIWIGARPCGADEVSSFWVHDTYTDRKCSVSVGVSVTLSGYIRTVAFAINIAITYRNYSNCNHCLFIYLFYTQAWNSPIKAHTGTYEKGEGCTLRNSKIGWLTLSLLDHSRRSNWTEYLNLFGLAAPCTGHWFS